MENFVYQHPATAAFLLLAIIFGSFLAYILATISDVSGSGGIPAAFAGMICTFLTIGFVLASGVAFCLGF